MKHCSRCKETKDFAEFNRNASTSTGYQHECRPCHNARALEYADKAKDFLESQRQSGETLRYTAVRLAAESMDIIDYVEWLMKWTKHNPETDCYEWQGHIGADGYGRYNVSLDTAPKTSTSVGAHRLSFALSHGIEQLPLTEEMNHADSLVLDHECGVRSCVNPLHLTVTTCAENSSLAGHKRVAKKFSDLKVLARMDETGKYHSYA